MRFGKSQSRFVSQTGLQLSEFEALFQEYWDAIVRLLVRMVGNPAEAEDLALEAFYRLYQRYPTPPADFNTQGWLRKVAMNLALQSLRSFKRRERYELAVGRDVLEQQVPDSPMQILIQRDEHRLARLALAAMNPRQAHLLILRNSDLSYKEIAEMLELSPTSIGPLLLRAEREFEKHYRALAKE